MLVLSLYSAGLSTSAGRCPDCSCPAWGVKFSQTISPDSGTYPRGITRPLCRKEAQDQLPCAYSSTLCPAAVHLSRRSFDGSVRSRFGQPLPAHPPLHSVQAARHAAPPQESERPRCSPISSRMPSQTNPPWCLYVVYTYYMVLGRGSSEPVG